MITLFLSQSLTQDPPQSLTQDPPQPLPKVDSVLPIHCISNHKSPIAFNVQPSFGTNTDININHNDELMNKIHREMDEYIAELMDLTYKKL